MTNLQFIYSLPPLLTITILLALTGLTMMRGPRTAANRFFLIICLLNTMLYFDILLVFNARSALSALRICRLGHLFFPFLIPLFTHFFHTYLKVPVRPWLISSVYAYATILSAFSQSDWLLNSVQRFRFGYFIQGGQLYWLMAVGAGFAVIYNLLLLYRAIGQEKRSVQKNRLKYVFAGFGAFGILTSLNIVTMMGIPVYPPGNFSFVPLLIFAAGLFRYDLFDMGLVIRKSLIYSLLTVLLTLFYAGLIIGARTVFKDLHFGESFAFSVLLFLLVVLMIGPLKSRVQVWVDQLFPKASYNYQQTIKQASQTIATVLDYDKILELLRRTVIDGMQVDSCALYLASRSGRHFRLFAAAGNTRINEADTVLSADEAVVQHLAQTLKPVVKLQALGQGRVSSVLSDLKRLQAEVVLPMIFKERINGFLVMGEKRSGDLYSAEDLDMLEPLCYQSGVAIENAMAYQTLHELNQTLEAKVTARTAELKAALEEKERTQEQLVRSESLAAIGQLGAGVAHELNNPLTSVISLLQSAIEDLTHWDPQQPPDADLIDDLHFADKELARAKSIVASLLDLSRQTQTYEESVNLNLVVRDALRVLYNQYKYTSIQITENYEEALPQIQGNFANLGQVVINIVKNAIEAVDKKSGHIILTTRCGDNAGEVVFVCEDNGLGIDAQQRQNVFKPFFTTKPAGKGTGLGLYICHTIVQKHGGVIELSMSDRSGAVVMVRLPIVNPVEQLPGKRQER